MMRRRLWVVAGVVAGFALLVGCAGPADPDPGGDKTLQVARPLGGGDSNAASLYPASPSNIFESVRAIYDFLYTVDGEGQLHPQLATEWSSDESLMTWTFKLRDDVTFHDGSPFTADDVVYTMETLINPDLGSPSGAVLASLIEPGSVEATDEHTVVAHLTHPSATFPTLMVPEHAAIVKKGSFEDESLTGIGTGPFKVKSFERGSNLRVSLERNDDYWRGEPKLAGVELISLKDSQARQNALLSGDVDMLYYDNLTAQAADRLAQDDKIVIQNEPSGFWQSISMNMNEAPFDDVRVRQAFKLALDPQGLIDGALGGNGVPASDSPVAPTDPYRFDDVHTQDIPGAKRLLAEAGYPDGLDIVFATSDVSSVTVPLAVTVQDMVKEAGFRIELKQSSPDNYWSQDYGKYPLFSDYFNEYPADAILSLIYRPGAQWNSVNYDNPEVTAALDAARAEPDDAKRVEAYARAQRLIAADSPYAIPFFQNRVRALSVNVEGFQATEDQPDWMVIDLK